ncbi:MAG: protein translocase subunit SecD [Actinomycetota bacterium]|nr:protein translocase subunit SecD [Actinomycetota bacterium]
MKRRLWFSLIATVVAVIAALAGNIATSNEPILGLDLQGGLSVILAPEDGATGDDLLVVRDLVRSSLERSGVAEPDVRVQGSNIVVDLPGVKDKEEALRSVSVSGIVELRSVVNFTECAASSTPTVSTDETIAEGRVLGSDGTITVDQDPAGEPTPNVDEEGASFLNDEAKTSFRRSAPDPDTPIETVAPADAEVPADSVPADVTDAPIVEAPLDLTPTFTPSVTGAEFLPTLDGNALCAGPSQASGEVFQRDSASVQLGQFGGFSVSVDLRGDGEASWNALAGQCFNRLASCPSTGIDTDGSARPGQIAIVLDGIVQSAPVVNVPVFDGSVSITGSFTQDEADQLSDVLNRGAFPVQVTPQETRTVSASAGGDSLRAAIIAGLIGLALVLAFLVAYYRWLALVIICGLTVWAMAVYSAAAFVSGATNYALSLAGVTGIIVAIGVTVDSYVVFFERMKDEIRNGRTLRNAAPRSFNSTWRTIWSADLVSIIGALILFSLSVGSVRGFALYLGITTICDLFVCFFFTRPAVLLIARSKFMVGKRAFGLEVATS